MSRKQDALDTARRRHRVSELQRRVAEGTVVLHGADYIPVSEIRQLNDAGLRLADPTTTNDRRYIINAQGNLTQVGVAPMPTCKPA